MFPPPVSGAYVLVLRLGRALVLSVGRLGRFRFPAGVYVYLGQAGGAGGLRARLGRHLRGPARPRWHVDFLRLHAQVTAWGWRTDTHGPDGPWECVWSQALLQRPEVFLPAPGFGASDCQKGCPAHLVGLHTEQVEWLPLYLGLEEWVVEMGEGADG